MSTAPSAAGEVRGGRTVVHDLTAVSGLRVVSLLLLGAVSILATRLLTPAQYALVAYVTVASTLISAAAASWTTSATLRYGREELERNGHMRAVSTNRLLVATPLALAAALVVLALQAAGAMPPELSGTLVWVAIAWGFALIAIDHTTALLQAAGRMSWSAAAGVAGQAICVLALAYLLVSGRTGAELEVILAIAGGAGISVLLLVPGVWRSALWPPRGDRRLLWRMAAYSIPLIAYSASQYFMRSVDIVALRAFGSAHDVGVYSIAYQAYTVLQTIPATIVVVLTPLFVSLRETGRESVVRTYLHRLVPQLSVLATLAVAAALPWVDPAVRLVFGSGFADAGTPLTILMASLLLFGIASLLAPVVVLHERGREIGVIYLFASSVNLIGDLVLLGVFSLGPPGAAIATTAALLVVCGGYLAGASRSAGVAVALPPGPFGVLALSGAAALVTPWPLAALVALAACAAHWLFGVRRSTLFGPEDIELLARMELPAPLRSAIVRVISLAAPLRNP